MDNETKEMFQQLFGRLDQMDGRLDQIDGRLDQMGGRLDVLEMKQDITSKKLDDLKLDVQISERNIKREIHKLNDEMDTVVEVLRQHELIPN